LGKNFNFFFRDIYDTVIKLEGNIYAVIDLICASIHISAPTPFFKKKDQGCTYK